MSTALVLLAAGLSRRMGQDKLLMKRHGKPLYRFSLELMGSFPDTSRLVVSTSGEIIDAAQALGFHTIGNPLAAQGMGTSVAAATACLREERAVFLNADQPYFTAGCLALLLACAQETDAIVVPRVQGLPKSPCVFPRRFYPDLMMLEGDQGGRAVYQLYPEEVHYLDFPDPRPFQDFDTPEDWARDGWDT